MDIQYKIDCIIESLNSLSNMEIIYEKFDDKIQESYTKLKEYDSHDLSSAILNKYKNQYHNLSHVKINNNTYVKWHNQVDSLDPLARQQLKAVVLRGIRIKAEHRKEPDINE